jgi:hypothetical protein
MNPKQEAEMLMNAILPVAEKMLKQYGEFYPYGGFMKLDGSIVHVGAADPDTDRPKSKDVLYVLWSSFREMAERNECKAVAVAFDISVALPNSGQKSDAIQVSIEHVDGYSVEVFFPYRLTNGELIYGETLVQQGKHEVFGVPS